MEFLDTPQKISTLRKTLKLKQFDFETDNFTRGYLGLNESNRRKLTRSASQVIVKRFRERIKELGLDMEIDDDYFIRTPKEDAIKYCGEKLKDQDKLTDDELVEITNISEIYGLSDFKIKSYLMRGINAGKSKQHIEAYVYLIDALTSIHEDTSVELKARVHYSLGTNRFILLDYICALNFYKMSLKYYEMFNETNPCNDKISKTLFNIGTCYKKLEDYPSAISYIEKSIKLYDFKRDLNTYVRRQSIKANCWKRLGELDKAINIYQDLIQYIKYIHDGEPHRLAKVEDRLSSEEKGKIAFVYNNLAEVFVLKGQYSKAMDYFNESEKIRIEVEPSILSHTLVEKSKLYYDNNMIDEAIECVNKALQNAQENNDYEYIIECYNIIINCFKEKQNSRAIEDMLEKQYSVLVEIGKYKDAIRINNELLTLYTNRNDIKSMDRCRINTNELLEFL